MKAYIKNIVLKAIDETIGKKFPIIDELTDVFQDQDKKNKEQDKRIGKLDRQIKMLKNQLKEKK